MSFEAYGELAQLLQISYRRFCAVAYPLQATTTIYR